MDVKVRQKTAACRECQNICNSTERLDVGEKRQISVLKIQKYSQLCMNDLFLMNE